MKIPWLEPFRTAAAQEAGRPIVISLATVDEAGDSQVRSVICRRVDDEGVLWIASDGRSAKNRELTRHPRAAAAAWFPATREQFRFSGSVQILGPSAASSVRAEFWRTLSPETRATFFWPHPGQPRIAADDVFAKASDDPDPPTTFGPLVLHPTMVDHLVLTSHPHRRRVWTWEGGWDVRELNP